MGNFSDLIKTLLHHCDEGESLYVFVLVSLFLLLVVLILSVFCYLAFADMCESVVFVVL